jgi:hypothetical protein
MTASFAMSVPGSRPLAGWWRDLGAHEPARLWFAHLALHRLEVLVEGESVSPLDAVGDALLGHLRTLPLPADLTQLPADLHLDPALFRRIVDHLVGRGLLSLDAGGRVSPTSIGSVTAPRLRQRHILYFTDGMPAYFLPLEGTACAAMMPPAGWAFGIDRLDEFATRPADWRRDNRFPADIRRFLHPADLPEAAQAEAVIVDRAEQSLLALVQTGDAILGFPVGAENWELRRTPALTLPTASDFASALLAPLPVEAWRHAWLGWCQQRSLPGNEADACQLEPADHRLVVRAPGRLVDKLRQGRSEALRGEAWLLAGAGRVRHAAVIELV